MVARGRREVADGGSSAREVARLYGENASSQARRTPTRNRKDAGEEKRLTLSPSRSHGLNRLSLNTASRSPQHNTVSLPLCLLNTALAPQHRRLCFSAPQHRLPQHRLSRLSPPQHRLSAPQLCSPQLCLSTRLSLLPPPSQLTVSTSRRLALAGPPLWIASPLRRHWIAFPLAALAVSRASVATIWISLSSAALAVSRSLVATATAHRHKALPPELSFLRCLAHGQGRESGCSAITTVTLA
ncbi:hypothetical protein Scep_000051 [Stephania cephalantha]|uniref:Uncharacterized protein n=1 Tax=Stephania cephalantha TaxID=152367 RepID=A0AAP0Q2K2_9MAGN